jgi:hypothetical protein
MPPAYLELIQEIDRLWEPVYPYLARHIDERYGRRDGDIMEIGPFCGVIFTLLNQGIGSSFSMATFPPGMADFFYQEARRRGVEDKIEINETDSSLTGAAENRVDLAIFRGAFFFPSLFHINFYKIHQVLRPGGMALLGGGFGKFTPSAIIRDIGKRSRELNLLIGKIEVSEDQLRQTLESSHVKGSFEILSEGGLWVVIRREPPLP